jgi:hypothetical protein
LLVFGHREALMEAAPANRRGQMFIIILKINDVEKVYTQMFATIEAAQEKLNDFAPDFTGYVMRGEKV